MAMDFIFYAVENGLNKFSEPKMNGKITLSIFGMENDLVLFWYLRALNKMTLNFFQKSVNECLEILIIIIVIKYRPCMQLHLCSQW